jgi:WD40 repeat protein
MYKYKSFISYSRAADSRLAPEIKSALQGFAKAWYKLRAIQVFCDQTNLTANPDLWNSIEKNLADSEYFIYLASPQAAQSKWVRKEIEFFHNKRGTDKLIIIVTDGNIVWDDNKTDFNWELTDAIPNLKQVFFEHEPTWLDLKWIRKEQLSSRDPRFLDAIANLSATLRGIDKDTLIGKDVEEHRKVKRFRLFSMTGLTLLALFLITATIIAIRSESRSQERLVRTFTGNGKALLENGDYLMAIPWFVEAMANERDDEKKELNKYRVENLFNQVPELVQVWQTELPVLKTAFIESGNVLVVSGNPVNWWTNEFDCFDSSKGKCKAVLTVVNTATGNDVFSPIVMNDGIRQWALNSDKNLFVSLSISNVLRLWNPKEGKLVWEHILDIPVTKEAFYCQLSFNKQNTHLLFVHDSNIEVYETIKGNMIASYNEKNRSIGNAAFLEDGNRVIFSGASLQVWDAMTKKVIIKKLPFDMSGSFKLSPDTKHMAILGETVNRHFQGNGPSTISVLTYVDLENSEEPLFTKELESNASKIEFDANGTVIGINSSHTTEGGSSDEGTRVWDVLNGNPLTDWIRLSQEVDISFDSEGKKILLTCRDGTTQLWQIADQSSSQTSARVSLFHDGNHEVKSIFSPDNRYVLTSGKGHIIKLWKIPDDTDIQTNLAKDLVTEEDYDTTMRWHVSYGASGDDTTNRDPTIAYVYEVKTNKKIGAPLKHKNEVYLAEISKDGSLIATAALNEAHVWRRDNQQKLFSFTFSNNAAISSISFSPDSKKILTSFTDYTSRVWDAKTGQPVSPYIRHPFSSTFVDQSAANFSKDGKKIITSDHEKYLLWDASTGDPLSAPIKYKYVNTDEVKDSTNKQDLKKAFSIKLLSTGDIKNYSELISNQMLDASGLVPLSTQEYLTKWEKWKAVRKNKR